MIDEGKLKKEIKDLIIRKLDIQHITSDEIPDDVPLFSPENPLGLDSIDAIEIVVGIEEQYGVRIGEGNNVRVVMESINSISGFLISIKKKTIE